MRTILHILSQPDSALAKRLIALEGQPPETQSEVVDLNTGEPDYAALVGKIFTADSVQVW